MKLSTIIYTNILALALVGFSDAEDLMECVTCKAASGVKCDDDELDCIHFCGYSEPNKPACDELREKVYFQCTNPKCGQFFSMNAEPNRMTPNCCKKCDHQNIITLSPYSSTSKSVPLLNFLD
ncbi:hypothetical protein PGTUg99_003920 [Puccinia graminis f. sp. tritici]|uniref:Secreted protein n=2 Tax=Puccinia graminis f. sp. tritici TaxID=56615 RepID=E3JV74_PUCGT|nr:uncharacterized protein PGTG_01280 [Puccinia graminis f. sp. tritici CRL 75-36-700-3]EFP75949.2 hypothetical protein PGTG_01280 [Puccinia graminis f. sp. tritici CRL 75-36-700-3]KAA1137390.1 hypothetical protein PGTUg99_003920 [Puccinia graminis f. sp. tritici]